MNISAGNFENSQDIPWWKITHTEEFPKQISLDKFPQMSSKHHSPRADC